jgi:hypothetical protein
MGLKGSKTYTRRVTTPIDQDTLSRFNNKNNNMTNAKRILLLQGNHGNMGLKEFPKR